MAWQAPPTRRIMYALLTLLTIDSLFELSFIVDTVHWLHRDHPMNVAGPNGSAVILKGKPAGMMVNQGHTSNGAAGTNIVLVGIVGSILLGMRKSLDRMFPKLYRPLLTTWVVFCILAFLLTTAALAYTMNVTDSTSGQVINLSGLQSPIRYPNDKWVPQTWFGAILDDLTFLPVTSKSVEIDGALIPWASRGDVKRMYRITNGWKYNLIPMFLLQLALTPLIVLEYLSIRKEWRSSGTREAEKTHA